MPAGPSTTCLHAVHPMQIAVLCGSWSEWQAAGSVYEFRSSSMGAAYWHPDAPNGWNRGGPVWSASQKALIKDAINTYKTRSEAAHPVR